MTRSKGNHVGVNAMMKDTLGREKVTVHIAKKLYKKNPKDIREWLPQSGLSEASQQRIIRNQ